MILCLTWVVPVNRKYLHTFTYTYTSSDLKLSSPLVYLASKLFKMLSLTFNGIAKPCYFYICMIFTHFKKIENNIPFCNSTYCLPFKDSIIECDFTVMTSLLAPIMSDLCKWNIINYRWLRIGVRVFPF